MKYLIGLLPLVSSLAFAGGSTINAAIPAVNSALQSAPIRSNFQAAQNDINNLIEQNFGTTAPASPLLGQLWMNTTSTPYNLEVFDGTSWVIYGSLNATTHSYQNFSIPWSGITGTPTTLAGYGITNAVSSVALTMPSIFNVSGSPVTGTGTFVATLASQAPNLFLASPNGSTGTPTMRAITSADLPAGTGTVSSVALSLPGTFTVSGSPITSSGTLTGTYVNQSANTIFAGPATGSATTPGFRALVANDIAAVNTKIYNTNTTAPASTAFVQSVVEAAQSTLPLNLGSNGGGTYSFDGVGTGLTVVYNTSGGAITSILTIANGGTGYAVGDLEQIIGTTGNNDAVVHVLTVSSGVVTSVEILYGGTGYTGTGAGGNSANFSSFLFYALTLTGTLTSNANFILSFGTYLTTSSHGVCNNNTTGAFSVNIKQGNGSNTGIGTGVTCPQGSSNNSAILVEQDGVSDIWQEAPGLNGSSMNLISLGATTPGTGAFTALSASSTVSGTGFSNYLASPPAIGGTTAASGRFTTLTATTSNTFADSSTITSSGYASSGVTGGAKGAGTINVAGLFVGGVAVNAGGTATSTNALNSATTVVNVSSATAPSSGQVLTATSSTAATWQTPANTGGYPSNFVTKTANYTAVAGDNILADTSGGVFTITLPASPSAGNMICVTDAAGTFAPDNLTIAGNLNNIMSSSSNMTVSTNYASFCLEWYTTTPGWRIK